MPKKKTLVENLLSKEEQLEINRLIVEGDMTLDALVGWLGDRGYKIGRSSVHRHSQNIDAFAKKLKQSRSVTSALVKELGDAATQGEQGRLLVEMTRALVFDFLVKAQDSEEGSAIDAKEIMMLGKGLAELAKSMRYDQDFEMKISDRVEKKTKEAAAKAVNKVGKTKGLTKETLDAIVGAITGDGG